MLQADIDQIRTLAGKLRDAGTKIDDMNVRTGADGLAAAMPDYANDPGSGIPQAVAQAAEFVEGAYLRVAERYRQVATLCVESADRLETTDQEFAGTLSALDVHRA